jgi:hypothetical protein
MEKEIASSHQHHFLRPSESRTSSDAHESSILDEVLDLASFFLPRNRLGLLVPYSRILAYSPVSISSLALFLRRLDTPRGYSRVCHPPR